MLPPVSNEPGTSDSLRLRLSYARQGWIQNSRRKGRQPWGWRALPTYDFAKFSEKLHDIDNILGRGGGGGIGEGGRRTTPPGSSAARCYIRTLTVYTGTMSNLNVDGNGNVTCERTYIRL